MNFNNRRRFKNRFSSSSTRYNSRNNGIYSSSRGNNRGQTNNIFSKIKSVFLGYLSGLRLEKRSNSEKFTLIGATLFTCFMVVLTFSTAVTSVFLPSVKNAEQLLNVESTVFYDRNGTVLYTVHGEQNREVVTSEEIPSVVKQAAVAIEDERFFRHRGFDIRGITVAIFGELGLARRRGGSTITQQFVKNAYLSRERTYNRKFKEIILATKIERHYTKDEILTMYLNKIPYGGTAYGVQKAAEVFFAKNVEELGLPEAVILAAIPQAPTYFSPFGSNRYSTLNKEFELSELQSRKIRNVTDLKSNEYNFGLIGRFYQLADGTSLYLPGRTDEVLRKMEELEMITSQERAEGLLAVQNYEFNDYVASIKAPHFVFYVKEQLERKYGRELVENGGLRVQTTLDYALYEESLNQVRAQIQTNRNNFNARNAAAITINPQTGEILSMVGSANYHDVEIDGSVNMTTASRQPGSAFKPIVYAGAFLRTAGAGTIFYDVPTRLDQDTPRNYDGTFRGPISVRTALAQSRNIPAVKAYFMAGEQDGIIALSESMGISTLDRRIDYGWPLALGSGEVRMIDMAEAFGVFANGGDRVQVNSVMKVTDNRGRILEDNTRTQPRKFRVLDPGAAYIINHILSDRSMNLSQQMNLPEGRVSAMKTGTSTKRVGDTSFPSNLWTVGYTPQLVTVVWAGNSNGEEMRLGADGTNGAVPIWNRIMSYALRNTPQVNFERPENVVSTSVSRLSGKLPGPNTPASLVFSDLFTTTTVPREADNSFFRQSVDIRNNKRPNQFCPPEMVQEVTFYNPQSEIPGPRFNWRQEIIDWFEGLSPEQLAELNLGENVTIGMPIEEDSELCNPDLANKFLDVTIVEPAENSVIPRGLFTVVVSPEAESGIEKVEFFFNNDLAETVTSQPWSADLRIPVGFRPGREFRIRAKITDRNGFSREKAINLITGESNAESVEWELMEEVPAE